MPDSLQRLLEFTDDPSRSADARVARNEIVVVKVDAVGAELAELADDLVGRDRRTHRIAERIAARIADGPEAEGEVMFRLWCVECPTSAMAESCLKRDSFVDCFGHRGLARIGADIAKRR